MEYVTHFRHRDRDRSRTPRPTFRPRVFAAALGLMAFTLLYVSIGIRWHTYRARASLYAQEEMELTFQAADYRRASHALGLTDDAVRRAQEYRRLAEMCSKAAEERAQLRKLYEEAW